MKRDGEESGWGEGKDVVSGPTLVGLMQDWLRGRGFCSSV